MCVCLCVCVFFVMIRRPPRSTLDRSSAASDVYKRQDEDWAQGYVRCLGVRLAGHAIAEKDAKGKTVVDDLSLIHISEPTRPY